jgi:hypothetical protein
MIDLSSSLTESTWIELTDDVKVKVKPLNSLLWNTARAGLDGDLRKMRAESDHLKSLGEPTPDWDDENVRQAYVLTVLTKRLAIAAIEDWQGVKDNNKLVTPTADTISRLMDMPFLANQFYLAYTRTLDVVEQEKNA